MMHHAFTTKQPRLALVPAFRRVPVRCMCGLVCEACGERGAYRLILPPKEVGGTELRVCRSCYGKVYPI